MTYPETILWHDARHVAPDVDTTVLVCTPCGSEPVYLGFFGGAAWHAVGADGPIEVNFWANMPEGPIG